MSSRSPLEDSAIRDRLSDREKRDILESQKSSMYWLEYVVLNLRQSPTNKEISDTYGSESIKAYRVAERTFQGTWRGCGNPTIAHTQDTAYRLKLSVGKNKRYMQAALLHDVVEDKSKSFREIEDGLERIVTDFGEEVAEDVDALTNKYSVLAKAIEKRTKLSKDDDIMRVKGKIHETLDQIEEETKREGLYQKYGRYIQEFRLMIRGTQKEHWSNIRDRFHMFTLYDFLKFRSYDLYLEEIKKQTLERATKSDPYYDVPLLVKLSDSIDNIRTTNPFDKRRFDKLVVKTESRIRLTKKIVEELRARGFENLELEARCKQLKSEYVHFLGDSIAAAAHFEDSRWSTVREYIQGHYESALEHFYRGTLPPRPEEDLSAGL
jgi:hypothetical protein